jgi:RHS repeat-associated protein
LTEFLYSGEQFDSKIGQQYLRQRYYDPATGRFNRLDPFFGNHADPQDFHKYLYTHADPINGIDPSGLMSVSISVAVSVGAKIGATVGAVAGGVYGVLKARAETGSFFTSKSLLYAAIGTITGAGAGAAVGALAGVCYSLLASSTLAPAKFLNDLLVIKHPTVLPWFVGGVITGLGLGLASPASVETLIVAGISGGVPIMTAALNTTMVAVRDQLPKAIRHFYMAGHLFYNWAGRSVSPHGVTRVGYMWGVPYCVGFIVGYAAGSTTKVATDYLIELVNFYDELPPVEEIE